MAKAGDRYEVTTGNIWGYAHRGDLTGVKAALARGVDVDLVNTAGWTAAHAAAAGGHAKVLSVLLRAGAALDIRDRGGNLALHEACKGGHASAVRVLVAAPGSPGLETVRLSQTKGAEVRALVADALRAAGKDSNSVADRLNGDKSDTLESVGYARKQVKSNAFFGPRRTPISCKLKKQLLQTKRQGRRQETENNVDTGVDAASDSVIGDLGHAAAASTPPPALSPAYPPATSWGETVRQIKGNKLSRGGHRAKAAADTLGTDWPKASMGLLSRQHGAMPYETARATSGLNSLLRTSHTTSEMLQTRQHACFYAGARTFNSPSTGLALLFCLLVRVVRRWCLLHLSLG